MSDLQDAFGEEFAQRYRAEKQKRQERRNSVDEETVGAICARAINENEFDEGNPRFEFTDDEGITHTVMLMQFPDMENDTVYTYARELSTGAVSIPFDYMGEWVSCLFNEGKEKVADFVEGRHYILVGQHGTYETNNGEEREQLQPVRGIVDLDEAKELANRYMSDEGFGGEDEEDNDDPFSDAGDSGSEDSTSETEPPEPDSEPADDDPFGASEDDEDDESDAEDIFGGGEEEEEEDTYPVDEIQDTIDKLAQKDDRVWEVEDGDSRHQKLTKVVQKRVDDADDMKRTADEVISYIESQRGDDEEEEDEEDALFS
jgi:hypothetical protein